MKLVWSELLNKTLENFDYLKSNIEGRTPNWDSERIAQIDYIILIINCRVDILPNNSYKSNNQ